MQHLTTIQRPLPVGTRCLLAMDGQTARGTSARLARTVIIVSATAGSSIDTVIPREATTCASVSDDTAGSDCYFICESGTSV
jgi:hypothetical protein